MKCYHHNDLDGRCAGAIVLQEYPLAKMIEVDYKDKIDVDAIEKNEHIFIVDFSFKPEVMAEVLNITDRVIWIDHHKTAFEYDYSRVLPGIREIGFSGCELTWKYFNGSKEAPMAVKYIGDYDTWTFKYGNKTKLFHIGLGVHDTSPESPEWTWLIYNDKRGDYCRKIMSEGRICEEYLSNFTTSYRKAFGFETKFHGYKAYALNLYKLGSSAFGEKFKEYDLVLSFVYDGKKWTIGLYSDKIDVGKLAQKHGGGGHTGAAGFVCDELNIFKTEELQ